MTEQAERYDRIADGYARWWGPIIAPAAVTVLDEIGDAVAAGATRLLDVGTGNGTLAIAAIRRWPEVRVTALDASSGMIAKAAAEAESQLTDAERRRLTLRVAFADDLGLADGSVDVAGSSFASRWHYGKPCVYGDAIKKSRVDSASSWGDLRTGGSAARGGTQAR